AINPNTEATTSHTAALTNSTKSGMRHDASISRTGAALEGAVEEVAFIAAATSLERARFGRRRRRIGLVHAGNQIGAGRGGIFPLAFSNLQSVGNPETNNALGLVDPADVLRRLEFRSADFAEHLGAF